MRNSHTRSGRAILALAAATALLPAPASAVLIHQHAFPEGSTPASAIFASPTGLLINGGQAGTVYNRVTTTPSFRVTAGPPGVAMAAFTAGPDGNPWGLGFITEPPNAAGERLSYFLIQDLAPSGVTTRYRYTVDARAAAGKANSLTTGPDGAIWITAPTAGRIQRFSLDGNFAEYEVLSGAAGPVSIVSGPNGALWFTDIGTGTIGEATVAGEITQHLIPDGEGFGAFGSTAPYGLAVGPDGAVWFTEENHGRIGRMTSTGQLQEFAIPTPAGKPLGAVGTPTPRNIVLGPDGALWFTDPGSNSIGRITTAGEVTEYPTGEHVVPDAIASFGGELWFTEAGVAALGSADPNGTSAPPPAVKAGLASSPSRCRKLQASRRHAGRERRRSSRAWTTCRRARRR